MGSSIELISIAQCHVVELMILYIVHWIDFSLELVVSVLRMDEVVGIPTAGASQPPSHADGPTNLLPDASDTFI